MFLHDFPMKRLNLWFLITSSMLARLFSKPKQKSNTQELAPTIWEALGLGGIESWWGNSERFVLEMFGVDNIFFGFSSGKIQWKKYYVSVYSEFMCIYITYVLYAYIFQRTVDAACFFPDFTKKATTKIAETKKETTTRFFAKASQALRRNNSKPCSACRKFHACRPNSYSARAFCSRSPSNWGTCHTCGSKWTNPEILTICVGWTYLK